jgi:hypothetical protein
MTWKDNLAWKKLNPSPEETAEADRAKAELQAKEQDVLAQADQARAHDAEKKRAMLADKAARMQERSRSPDSAIESWEQMTPGDVTLGMLDDARRAMTEVRRAMTLRMAPETLKEPWKSRLLSGLLPEEFDPFREIDPDLLREVYAYSAGQQLGMGKGKLKMAIPTMLGLRNSYHRLERESPDLFRKEATRLELDLVAIDAEIARRGK